MQLRNRSRFALLTPGLLLSTNALAHPGHQHAPGVLAGLNHAVTGWDQLAILLLVGGVLVHYLLRGGN